MKTLTQCRKSGFSLAELMVVIVIIGLLATLVVPKVLRNLFVANVGKAKADIVQISSAVDQYAIENNGRYPESLEVLVTPDENGFTYLSQETVPKDPWGYTTSTGIVRELVEDRMYPLTLSGLEEGLKFLAK